MCYMSHVTKNFSKYPMSYIFLESSCKIKFNGHDKKCHMSHVLHFTSHTCYMSHFTYITCHRSHMLHVTNIKLKRTLSNTPCVIYFWKFHTKFSAMVMIKTLHVTYVTCPMSHMLHVPCHTCYMSHVTCPMSHMLHVPCHTCYM